MLQLHVLRVQQQRMSVGHQRGKLRFAVQPVHMLFCGAVLVLRYVLQQRWLSGLWDSQLRRRLSVRAWQVAGCDRDVCSDGRSTRTVVVTGRSPLFHQRCGGSAISVGRAELGEPGEADERRVSAQLLPDRWLP